MQAGDRVFVAYAITDREVMSIVYPATVIAAGDRGYVVVKTDHGSLLTAGGPFSVSRVFGCEIEAWRWSAGELRAAAAKVLAAADKADAKADGVALQAAGA